MEFVFEGKVVGTLKCAPYDRVLAIHVEKHMRRKGVATAMLKQTEQRVSDRTRLDR